jgi:hypothetical protein
LGTVTTQSPSLLVVIVVPFDEELAPEIEVLLDWPLPEFAVTDGPPEVELCTPPGPAVTELDRLPVFLASSDWTTLHGLPFGPVVTVVPPETPFGPVVTVLVCAWLMAQLAIRSAEPRKGRARRSMVHLLWK